MRKIRRVRERRAGPNVTYALIPVVPELVKPLVETNGESEGAGEDAGDKDACRKEREFYRIRLEQGRTVPSSEGVVETISELEVRSWSLHRRRHSKSTGLRPYSVGDEGE